MPPAVFGGGVQNKSSAIADFFSSAFKNVGAMTIATFFRSCIGNSLSAASFP
jgi:hypothetical protein